MDETVPFVRFLSKVTINRLQHQLLTLSSGQAAIIGKMDILSIFTPNYWWI